MGGFAERSCWYLLGMRFFSLIDHAISSETKPTYWPGDDIPANTRGSDDYQKVKSERMDRLRGCISSDDSPTKFPGLIPIAIRRPTFFILSLYLSLRFH